MKIKINSRLRDFRGPWIRTLEALGLLSGNPTIDSRVIGEIREEPWGIYLEAPDLPYEALEILRGYFKYNNINYGY